VQGEDDDDDVLLPAAGEDTRTALLWLYLDADVFLPPPGMLLGALFLFAVDFSVVAVIRSPPVPASRAVEPERVHVLRPKLGLARRRLRDEFEQARVVPRLRVAAEMRLPRGSQLEKDTGGEGGGGERGVAAVLAVCCVRCGPCRLLCWGGVPCGGKHIIIVSWPLHNIAIANIV